MKDKEKQSSAGSKWIIAIFVLVLISSIFITELMNSAGKKIEEINITRYTSELAKTDEKLVLLKKNDCTKCDEMEKVLEKIKSEGTTVYSINVDNLSDTESSALLASSDLIKDGVLPKVIHVSAGAIIGSYTDEAKYDNLVAFMTVFKTIKVKEYLELAKEDVEHFIWVGRPTCGYCVQSMPWTKRISRDLGKDIYYIDIDNETANDLQLLATQTNNIYKGSTPLFLKVKNNQVVTYKEGAGSYDELNAFFSGTSGQ